MAYSGTMEVQYETNGMDSLREVREATAQPRPHSHNEIEIMLLESGAGIWLMGGDIVSLKPKQLVVFWALRPHQLIKCDRKTVINWLTIPLAVFIQWQLPEHFSKLLLGGSTVL